MSPMMQDHQVNQLGQIGKLKPFDGNSWGMSNQNNLTGAYTMSAAGDRSEDFITTIDCGEQSSYLNTSRRFFAQISEKDDFIEQLKTKVEMLESEKDNKNSHYKE